MRRPQHDGQKQRPLHEKATKISCPHSSQRNRAKPRASTPQERNSRSSARRRRAGPRRRRRLSPPRGSSRGAPLDGALRSRAAGVRTGALRARTRSRPAPQLRAHSPPRGGVTSERRARCLLTAKSVRPLSCRPDPVGAAAECGHIPASTAPLDGRMDHAQYPTFGRTKTVAIRLLYAVCLLHIHRYLERLRSKVQFWFYRVVSKASRSICGTVSERPTR